MDKMRMESVNMTEKNIEIIEKFFPNCITERTDVPGGRGVFEVSVPYRLIFLLSIISKNITSSCNNKY